MQEYLQETLSKLGIDTYSGEAQLFEEYYHFLYEYNQKVNLTRIVDEKDVVEKHFADSLIGASLIPQGARVLDVGSGAGFPAVPLMIHRSDIKVTMIDSIGKKTNFLTELISHLGLTNGEVLHTRAEDLAKTRRESYDIVTARAVAPMSPLIEYCLPLVRVGGKFLAYKTTIEDFAEGERACKTLGGRLGKCISTTLPHSGAMRTIITIDKVSPTPRAYPRAGDKARKQPL